MRISFCFYSYYRINWRRRLIGRPPLHPSRIVAMDICLSAARAEASRRNGAKSRGPKTPDGKARSAQNALKHGFRAQTFELLHDEDAGAFEALAEALTEDLAPVGALQALLARRLVAAAWRLERADRIERELLALRAERDERGYGRLGLALVRDGNGSRSLDTLLRYRGAAMAELWRALRALKALQAQMADEVCDAADEACDAPEPLPLPQADADGEAVGLAEAALCGQPSEPEARANPGEIAPAPPAAEPETSTRPDTERAGPSTHPCVPALEATQKCATMRHLCATHAPPSTRDT
jgi:hypothetical protein